MLRDDQSLAMQEVQKRQVEFPRWLRMWLNVVFKPGCPRDHRYCIDEAHTEALHFRRPGNFDMDVPQAHRLFLQALPAFVGSKTTEDESVSIELRYMQIIGRLQSQATPTQI